MHVPLRDSEVVRENEFKNVCLRDKGKMSGQKVQVVVEDPGHEPR